MAVVAVKPSDLLTVWLKVPISWIVRVVWQYNCFHTIVNHSYRLVELMNTEHHETLSWIMNVNQYILSDSVVTTMVYWCTFSTFWENNVSHKCKTTCPRLLRNSQAETVPSGVTVQQHTLLYCDPLEGNCMHCVMRSVKPCTVSVV